jgi:predicted nucleic acid-binding protein
MLSKKRIYLDANIFVEAFEGSGGNKVKIIDLLAGNDGSRPIYLFTSELTLAEVLVHPILNNNSDLVQSYDNVLNNSAILRACPIDQAVLRHAAYLRSQYISLKLPDAIHLSTAMSMRCTHFLSADKRLGNSYELPHARFEIVHGAIHLQTIRPDSETLQALISEFEV